MSSLGGLKWDQSLMNCSCRWMLVRFTEAPCCWWGKGFGGRCGEAEEAGGSGTGGGCGGGRVGGVLDNYLGRHNSRTAAVAVVVVVVVLDSRLQATTGITKSSHKSLPLGFGKTTEQTHWGWLTDQSSCESNTLNWFPQLFITAVAVIPFLGRAEHQGEGLSWTLLATLAGCGEEGVAVWPRHHSSHNIIQESYPHPHPLLLLPLPITRIATVATVRHLPSLQQCKEQVKWPIHFLLKWSRLTKQIWIVQKRKKYGILRSGCDKSRKKIHVPAKIQFESLKKQSMWFTGGKIVNWKSNQALSTPKPEDNLNSASNIQ